MNADGHGLNAEWCARIRERKGWDPNELLVLLHVADLADGDGHFSIEALRKFYDLRKDRMGRDVITRLVDNRVLVQDGEAGTVGLNPGPWEMERRGPQPRLHPEFPPEPSLARALTRKDRAEDPRGRSVATVGPFAAAAVAAVPPPPRSQPQLTVNSELGKEGSIELLNGEQFTVHRLSAQKEAGLMQRIEGFIARFEGPERARADMERWGGDWRVNWVRKFPEELSDAMRVLEGEAEDDGWRPHKSAGAALKDETRRLVTRRRKLRATMEKSI